VLLTVLSVMILAGCSSQERPEGIVERWLLALNQGGAGEPLRYAHVDVTDALAAEWRSAELGTFDVIEVGRATAGCGVSGSFVPFRVVRLDGSTFRSTACVDASEVVELFPAAPGAIEIHALPSEGGPSIGEASSATWTCAIATGAGLLFLGEALMWLARRRRPE
jgi:hypothetical protein